jgi:hypothetical protein
MEGKSEERGQEEGKEGGMRWQEPKARVSGAIDEGLVDRRGARR